MCSSKARTATGTLQPPRIVHVLPWSVDTTVLALWSVFRQVDAGNTHSPLVSTSGLHIITPSVTRTGCLPFRLLGLRLGRLQAPHAADGGLVSLGLSPEHAELAIGRHPEFRIEGAQRAVAVGVHDQHLTPSGAMVAAGAEHHVVVLVLAGRLARVPVRPNPSAGRDGHAGDALKGPVGDRVLRLRRADVFRRSEKHRFRAKAGERDEGKRDEGANARGCGATNACSRRSRVGKAGRWDMSVSPCLSSAWRVVLLQFRFLTRHRVRPDSWYVLKGKAAIPSAPSANLTWLWQFVGTRRWAWAQTYRIQFSRHGSAHANRVPRKLILYV